MKRSAVLVWGLVVMIFAVACGELEPLYSSADKVLLSVDHPTNGEKMVVGDVTVSGRISGINDVDDAVVEVLLVKTFPDESSLDSANWQSFKDDANFIDYIVCPIELSNGVYVWSGTMNASSEGAITFKFRADFDNGERTETLTIHSSATGDNHPPEVFITSPVNGQFVGRDFSISGTATDDVAVSRVEVKIDSGDWHKATGTKTWSYLAKGLGLDDHTVYVRAVDNAGKSSAVKSFSLSFSWTNEYVIGKTYTNTNVSVGSIAVRSNGQAIIVFYDESAENLKLAVRSNSGWSVSVLDEVVSANVGEYPSVVIDSQGYAHVSYYYVTYGDLRYKRETSSGWSSVYTIDSTGLVGKYNDIDVYNDEPYISYYDRSYTNLKLAWYDGSSWHSETVDNDGDVGKYSSIAVDSSGGIHISYYDFVNKSLKYAYASSPTASWSIETVDNDIDVGEYTSIAVDKNGYPHISYRDVYNGDLKYAYKDSSGWHIETVDTLGNTGKYTSIMLDSNGNPTIAYYADYPFNDLKIAYKDENGWHVKTVLSDGNVGRYCSMTAGTNGMPYITYYNYDNGMLGMVFSLGFTVKR